MTLVDVSMDEKYKASILGGTDEDVSVSATFSANSTSVNDVPYELYSVATINNVKFDIRFGRPGGGYIGTENIEEKVREAKLAVSGEKLHEQFQVCAPNLWADFLKNTREIKIKRIERNCVMAGQQFCARTLRQLLGITSNVQSVFFDWITNTNIQQLSSRERKEREF
jgi:hypothetical protein